MNPILLILILLGGPDDQVLGQRLADEMARTGGAKVQLLVGAAAAQELTTRFGIGPDDLLATRNLGNQLTRNQERMLMLHLSTREALGAKPGEKADVVAEIQVWTRGRQEVVTSIVGKGSDPLPGLLRNLNPILDPLLGNPAAASAPAQTITALVRREAWTEVLAELAAIEKKDPRHRYYEVLAYTRLERPQAAAEALARMREACGQHFLVAAAEELVRPAPVATADDLDQALGMKPVPATTPATSASGPVQP